MGPGFMLRLTIHFSQNNWASTEFTVDKLTLVHIGNNWLGFGTSCCCCCVNLEAVMVLWLQGAVPLQVQLTRVRVILQVAPFFTPNALHPDTFANEYQHSTISTTNTGAQNDFKALISAWTTTQGYIKMEPNGTKLPFSRWKNYVG